MKKLFVIIALLVFYCGFSQETPIDNSHEIDSVTPEKLAYPMAAVDVKPEFPGGIVAFQEFFAKNFRQPSQKGLSLTMFASVIISKDGYIENISIIQDPGYGAGAEATRVLDMCPRWKPGQENGKNVPVLYQFPIKIRT